MRLSWIAIAIAVTFPGAAGAACLGSGEPVFHCEFEGRGKAVDVCLQDNVAIYRFGPVGGEPEMLLARRGEDVGLLPWTGIGRWRSETVSFKNAETIYAISYAVDRLEPESPTLASVDVMRAGRKIAQLDCRADTIGGADFGSLFGAKKAVGLSWCRETDEWAAVCPE